MTIDEKVKAYRMRLEGATSKKLETISAFLNNIFSRFFQDQKKLV